MNLSHKHIRLSRLLLVAAICLIALPVLGVLATQTSDAPMVRLQYASFDPLFNEPAVPAGQQLQAQTGAASMSILQFSGPVQEEWKAAVEATGAHLYAYIPDYAFLARLDAAGAETARQLPFVRWIGPYHPAYRLSDSLRSGMQAQASGPVELSVEALPDADLGTLTSQVQSLGGSVSDQFADEMMAYLRVTVDAGQVQSLASLDGVVWVEQYLHSELFNDKGSEVMAVPAVRSRQGLYGSGQIVAVADTGLDVGTTGAAMSDDFEGQILSGQSICGTMGYPSRWNDFHGHGTHVSGSILGNGKLSGSNPAAHTYNTSLAGAAPETRLVFQSIDDPTNPYLECIPSNMKDFLFKPAYDVGARIHSNSWGGPTGDPNYYGGYDIKAQAADNAAWNYKDMLILYAAGNSGTDANSNGVVDPDSLGSPGTAKDVLTVGATENNRPTYADTWGSWWPGDYSNDPIYSDPMSNNKTGMAAFSSRGPADDGRIKPDIVAPGTFILSARSHDPAVTDDSYWDTYNNNYAYMGGTSMATPLTAGAAALAREWLVEKRGFDHPSAALMKAVLLNGAVNISPGQYGTGSTREIPATVPNSVSGWGRVDLVEGLSPNPPRQIWLQDTTAGLSTGGQATYTIHVGGAGSQAAQDAGPAFANTESQEQIEAAPALEADLAAQSTPEPPAVQARDQAAGHRVELSLESNQSKLSEANNSSRPSSPGVDVNLILDDGVHEWVYGVSDGGTAAVQFIWWNRFTPAAGEFPFDLEQIQVLFDSFGGVFTGDAIDLAVYQDVDGDPSNGATLLRVIHETVQYDDGFTWSVYDLATPVAVSGPGDVLIAVINRYVVDGVSPMSYPATADDTNLQNRSWRGWWLTSPPDPPNLPPDDFYDIRTDANWMVRGYGTTTGGLTPTPTLTPTATPVTPTPSGTPPTPTPQPVSGGPLRITLAWTDFPAIPPVAKALVNDLDLEVVAPNGTHFYGNSGLYTSGQCFRSPHWDACNNVEGVLVPNATYGNYIIIVHGYNVASGPQPFAVVASGDNLLLGNKRIYLPWLRK